MGCDAEGPQELEQVTALTLSLASLPGVEVSLRALDDSNLPDAGVLLLCGMYPCCMQPFCCARLA